MAQQDLDLKALARLWGKDDEAPRFRPAKIFASIMLLLAGFVLWSNPRFWVN